MTSKRKQSSPEISQMFQDVLQILQESSEIGEVKETSDVDALTRQMEQTLKELNQKAEEIYKATGMTREELRAFSEDPANFSEEEWKLLGQIRDQVHSLQERADEIVVKGMEEAFEAPRQPAPPPEKKKKPAGTTPSKKRVKKKDWLAG